MEKLYYSLNHYLYQHKTYHTIVAALTRYLVYPYYAIYPLMLIFLLITHSDLLIEVLLKPAFVFIFITIFRDLINRPRPYDKMDIKPIYAHKHGHSFPSRHTGAAMIIALMALKVNLILGIIMLICAIIIALLRILGGLHYISDVITAAVFAIIVFMI